VKQAYGLRRQGAVYRLLENYIALILGGLEEVLIAEPWIKRLGVGPARGRASGSILIELSLGLFEVSLRVL
jgi:hypothetical protein